MDDIIIWGAGKAALKRYDWAVFAGYDVLFFVDNDAGMWGEKINGIPVCSPEAIQEYDCIILTPDRYFDEIKVQLDKMAYKGRQMGVECFMKEALYRACTNVDLTDVNIGDNMSFVFDAYFPGNNWGGTEEWSCTVANALSKSGGQTWMICGMNDKFDVFTHNCLHFDDESEINMIKKMAQKIAERLPCVVISRLTIVLYAAQVVKTLFPDKVKIVAMVHSDDTYNYRELTFWSDKIDKIICISQKISSELQRYGVKKELLEYRPNPIQLPKIAGERAIWHGTLKVGFAGRLVKELKRAHLLTGIIETCMQKEMDVQFNIAGEGDCLELLRTYVTERQWENKVSVLGWIPPSEMEKFWKEQDVYLNISSAEGMSLAMLEAMACGAVPVVTDVSGVSDVIEDGKNGFVVSVEEWLEAADKIEILNNNRELLHSAGVCNMKLMREKCNVDDYAGWMKDTFTE